MTLVDAKKYAEVFAFTDVSLDRDCHMPVCYHDGLKFLCTEVDKKHLLVAMKSEAEEILMDYTSQIGHFLHESS